MIKLDLYSISDGIEVSLFIILFYMLHRWLFNQEDTRLLGYWYMYESIVIVSYMADLHALFFFLGVCFPPVVMLGIIFHQQALQKMFVVSRRLDPLLTTNHTSHWIDELIKYSLIQLNAHNDFRVIIEYRDNLSPLVSTTHEQHAAIKKNTLELLYHSLSMQADSFLLITCQGTIQALCAHWKDVTWNETETIISQTDCIALFTSSISRRYTIIKGSTRFENLSAPHARALLTELHYTSYHKEASHDNRKNHVAPYRDTHISY